LYIDSIFIFNFGENLFLIDEGSVAEGAVDDDAVEETFGFCVADELAFRGIDDVRIG